MSPFLAQLRLSLRLYFRNRMAMLYGYLFPSILLIAFYVLYRYERVPLVRHMGELLTVTILGGACFGLATSLVSERERGVWRRYRLSPIPAGTLVASTLTARYLILLTAGLLQILLAMTLGMPLPAHPLGIVVAFTVASFAFLGLGLVIAMLADNVPAVQALGQCIFLPMLIIGGVAVPLTSLPDWALHLSAYFPGRYAVEAIQSTVDGEGLDVVVFSLLALTTIGLAACVAGAGMFRWDAGHRFMAARGKRWLAVALGGWAAVGLAAQVQDRIVPSDLAAERMANAAASTAEQPVQPPAPQPILPVLPAEPPEDAITSDDAQAGDSTAQAGESRAEPARPAPAGDSSTELEDTRTDAAATPDQTDGNRKASDAAGMADAKPAPGPAANGTSQTSAPAASATEGETPADSAETAAEDSPRDEPQATPSETGQPAWMAITIDQIMADLVFDRLPPDSGVVTPVAAYDDVPPDDVWFDLDTIQAGLETWPPGRVPDILERVRNLLFVPAVVDVYQLPSEPFVPLIVFDILQRDIDRDVLIKALYEIAVNPDAGSDAAVDQLHSLGIGSGPADMYEVRNRVGVYAVKLIGRVTGKRPGR